MDEKIQKKIEYWIKSADSDLSASEALFNNGNYLQMSFFCHLVVEKYLKAYHWHIMEAEPLFTHNLIKLSQESGLFPNLTEEQKEFIASLMPLNIKGRYPDDIGLILSMLDKENFSQILIKTKEFAEWIKTLLTK